MYKFYSRFKNYMFYIPYEVDGIKKRKIKKFNGNHYVTSDKEEIEMLIKSKNVTILEEPVKRGRPSKED